MDVTTTLKKFGLEKAFKYLYKDPDENLKKMLRWAEKFSGKTYKSQIDMIRDAVENPENAFHPYIEHLLERADPEVVKTIAVNFFINENMIGYPKQQELKKKYNCNIPWAILLDPTSACNLHCIGCWAAEYGNKLNLTFEEMDSIITQGKDMGCYVYLFTGGEPLVRKDDIIRLCEKHNDCVFSTFTNGTLIDEKFADEMLRVKNFMPAISLEGMEEATDSRRGKGTFAKVIRAMEITAGTNMPETLSATFAMGALVAAASDTILMIWLRVVSSPTRVASQRMKPDWFTVAAETMSPGALSTGMDSPVSAASFTAVSPSITTPSTGIFSPGRTTKISPFCTCSMETVCSTPSFKMVAVWGASFIRLFRASVVLPLERASSILPTVISVRIMAADSK